jgi:hypothetical protein
MPNVSGTYTIPRRRGANRGPLLLLIGTPGTGKRPLGSYLECERGFTHLNFENTETRERYLGAGPAALRTRIDALRARGRGVVITWAAGDPPQLRDVGRLVSLGAAAVWCDSDRGAACRAHYAGAGRLPRLEFVDTFEADGSFRPFEAVSPSCSSDGRTAVSRGAPRCRALTSPAIFAFGSSPRRRPSPGRRRLPPSC